MRLSQTATVLVLGTSLASGSGCSEDTDAERAMEGEPPEADSPTAPADPDTPGTGVEDAPSTEADPLYLIYTNVYDPMFNATSLVHVVPTFDDTTVFDSSKALEVDGDYVDLSVPADNPNRTFYTSLRSEPKIQRWVVDDDGGFEMTGEIGLLNLGVTNAASLQEGLTFISTEQAYFIDFTSLTVVKFDPTEMLITDSFSIDGLADGLEEGVAVHAYYKHVDDGRIVVATNHSDETGWIALGKLLVVDTSNDTVHYDEQTRCGALSWTAKDPDGNMYFISHSGHAGPAEVGIGDDFAPCMVRVLAGANEFDDDYYVNLRDLMGGPAGALMQGVDGLAYTFGYSKDAEPLTVETLDKARGPVWDVYSFELGNEAGTLALVPGREPGAPFAVSGRLQRPGEDPMSYVTEVAQDFGSTMIYDTTKPENWQYITEVPGFVYGVFRLR